MGRKAEPGISYYYTKCEHIQNRKIKLLFNEFNSDGYWIWKCILSTAYATKGYYFDLNDEDEVELFATETCKKDLDLVKKVIQACIRRDLFDKEMFDKHHILTSDGMQETYLDATRERRRKGTSIEMEEDYLLIKILPSDVNILILPGIFPGTNDNLPRNNSEYPQQNPQSKVKESKVKESKVNDACEDFSAEVQDLNFEKDILKYFGFNEIANIDKLRIIMAFVYVQKNSGRLEYFENQFNSYKEYKDLSGEQKHNFFSYFGKQENQFSDGHWDDANWGEKLTQEKIKQAAQQEKNSGGPGRSEKILSTYEKLQLARQQEELHGNQ
ncbi:DUF4373 domain-containing protein [Desertivirga xinjiangensis]|uniref:DUF4373 domain-containing protein n=1 Tax=Desertivirga xinjiangensis TaxID=539206 RepID=UPI00210C5B8C|nr:DUF4373 domain-containing protein [Pedobacter xinjiangensis]